VPLDEGLFRERQFVQDLVLPGGLVPHDICRHPDVDFSVAGHPTKKKRVCR
jgi:hypothetical protein